MNKILSLFYSLNCRYNDNVDVDFDIYYREYVFLYNIGLMNLIYATLKKLKNIDLVWSVYFVSRDPFKPHDIYVRNGIYRSVGSGSYQGPSKLPGSIKDIAEKLVKENE